MSIRLLSAAAVLAVGVGQAEAAIVLPVPTEDNDTIEVSIYGTVTSSGWRCGTPPDCYDPEPPRSGLFYDFSPSQVLPLIISIVYHRDDKYDLTLSADGHPYFLYSGYVDLGADGYFSGSFTDGWDPFYSVDFRTGTLWFETDDLPYFQTLEMTLTDVMPAPIPLPGSAALFPIGAAALLFVRRRQAKHAA